MIRDIELSFIQPPIPERSCDWQATRKGYDEGDPIGRGRTPVVALADLLEQEEEIEADDYAVHVQEGGRP